MIRHNILQLCIKFRSTLMKLSSLPSPNVFHVRRGLTWPSEIFCPRRKPTIDYLYLALFLSFWLVGSFLRFLVFTCRKPTLSKIQQYQKLYVREKLQKLLGFCVYTTGLYITVRTKQVMKPTERFKRLVD